MLELHEFSGADSSSDAGSWVVIFCEVSYEKAYECLREHLISMNRLDLLLGIIEYKLHKSHSLIYTNVERGSCGNI